MSEQLNFSELLAGVQHISIKGVLPFHGVLVKNQASLATQILKVA